MSVDSFYQIVSGICFALAGLWWAVTEGRDDWLKDEKMRRLAGGVYASFLIPGVMSLGAQIGGENKLVWRSVFVIAALVGMYFNARLLSAARNTPQAGFFARNRWLVILLYLVVLVFGVNPDLAAPTGLKPIQIEAFVLVIIILIGHALAWEMMTRRPVS
jgi:hypothetical protein